MKYVDMLSYFDTFDCNAMNNSDNIPFHVIKTKLRRVKKQSGYGTLKARLSLFLSLHDSLSRKNSDKSRIK
jgi:hypothetical protein